VKKYHIQFDIILPEGFTKEQVEEWARYMCGDSGSIAADHPLIKRSFDPVFNTFRMVEEK
jgi:hypothetical protein